MKTIDYTEFEVKFYPVNKEEYRKKLLGMGAKLGIPERKMIRIVADKRGNPVLSSGKYVRVRDEGNVIRLSIKFMAESTGKMSDQKEIDVEVSDFEKTIKIIEYCGIKFNRRQENLREEWFYKGAQITIDLWPGLDPFSEIEAGSEEAVKEIAEELGFDWNKKIITPAAEVYAMVYRMDINEVLEKISYITFENNPFKNLKKYRI
ncbi:MAG: CYTH domain-containing protein [Candidatus Woesebacteria bacterium]|nr:CYTH domain-containing protein [Candidatus Woesebacteria bacterium]